MNGNSEESILPGVIESILKNSREIITIEDGSQNANDVMQHDHSVSATNTSFQSNSELITIDDDNQSDKDAMQADCSQSIANKDLESSSEEVVTIDDENLQCEKDDLQQENYPSTTDKVITIDDGNDVRNEKDVICLDFSDSSNSITEIQEDLMSDDNVSHAVEYDFSQIPLQISGSWAEFDKGSKNNFTRGCKWAPDGSCILTCSDDNILRLYNLPSGLWENNKNFDEIQEMNSVLQISEGELIYDYCWYPNMSSADPSTCCLASSSKNTTTHLWDAFTGELRCSYRSYNQMDEIISARSLSFDVDGERLFCGFEKKIRVFYVDSPGRDFEERSTYAKRRGQTGIISSFAFTASNRSISAVGSYNKTIGIYSEPSGILENILEGPKGGVTHLKFSPDGQYLYSGSRKDPDILCWDMRNLGTVLYVLRRVCGTHQRIYFDITRCGRYVVSGNQNGIITVWDTYSTPKTLNESGFDILKPLLFYQAHNDCVNGVSFHPFLPLLCSSSGQRRYPELLSDDESDSIFDFQGLKGDNSLRLWWIGQHS